MKKCLLFIPIIIITIQITILAQASGKIAGKVIDKDTGEPIPFANIFIEGTTIGSASDLDGNYVILNVSPGVYTVSASVIGYQKVSITDVRVNVDFTTRLDFQLSVGAINLPVITVQGERNPLIRQDLTNPTVAINTELIQELPVDQISDLIKLQAGVVVDNDGAIHIRGGRSNEIAYTLNGITLNDPYGNMSSIGLATNAVQEVSVSTGTFSAQYGNALSGVVNYVTKEGGDKFSFSLRSYTGDYFTNRDELFTNIDDIDPLNRSRIEATIGGPFLFLKNARFYVSGVFENYKGLYYGKRLYRTTDSYLSPDNFAGNDPRKGISTDPYYFNPYFDNSNGLPTGDGNYVPLNDSRNYNIQGNLSYRFAPTFKVKYEIVYDNGKYQNYSLSYKYNPDGLGYNYTNGLINSIDITHSISNNIFYTLKGSYGVNESEYYLYEDLNDPRYLPDIYRRTISNTAFYSGGTDNYRQNRKTKTIGIKGDLVAQLFKVHEVKLGFETRFHELDYEGYSIEIGKLNPDGSFGTLNNNDLLYDSTLVLIRRKPTSPSLYTKYNKKPTQISAYVQDKIEFASSFILNAGLRYEYFDPSSQYNPNLSLDLQQTQFGYITNYNKPSEVKHTLSPRISMSYPITDKAIIRLSYGHFYQMGSLSSLYTNPNYYVSNVGEIPTFGNPNVEPQKSIQYEIGLQQQLTEDMKVDVTGFYKDVSNYIYTQTIYTGSGRQYRVLSNLAYSNSKGVTISLLKRRAPGSLFSMSLDYTFSISEGNRTEPSAEIFLSEQSGKISETYLVPLDFHRSHVINGTINLSQPNNWNIGLIFNLQTGTPYTPSLVSVPGVEYITYTQNSGSQPLNWNVDLRLEKYFKIGPLNYSIFLQVENIFDTENEIYVYASSGRALTNVEQIQNAVQFSDIIRRINRNDPGLFPLSQINNYYSQRPERVSRPREIRLGFSILFN